MQLTASIHYVLTWNQTNLLALSLCGISVSIKGTDVSISPPRETEKCVSLDGDIDVGTLRRKNK